MTIKAREPARKRSKVVRAWSTVMLFAASIIAAQGAPAQPAGPRPPEPPETPEHSEPPDVFPSARALRHLNIMEKVIDQVLVESRYALVTVGPNCRGLFLPGYGALFVVELSPILDRTDVLHFRFNDDGSYDVVIGDDDLGDRDLLEGRTRNTGRRDRPERPRPEDEYEHESDTDIEIEVEDEDGGDDRGERRREEAESHGDSDEALEDQYNEALDLVEESLDRLRESGRLRRNLESLIARWPGLTPGLGDDPERGHVLELVAAELMNTVRDYGHTLRGVKPEEWIGIAIFPSDLDWRRDAGTRTLIQVRRSDIDAYNNGELSEEDFASRVEMHTQ